MGLMIVEGPVVPPAIETNEEAASNLRNLLYSAEWNVATDAGYGLILFHDAMSTAIRLGKEGWIVTDVKVIHKPRFRILSIDEEETLGYRLTVQRDEETQEYGGWLVVPFNEKLPNARK